MSVLQQHFDKESRKASQKFLWSRLHSVGGFTLLEAALAIWMMGLVFIGSGFVFANIYADTIFANRGISGVQLGREKIEAIMADKQFLGYGYLVNANYPAETLMGAYDGYRRNVFISEVATGDLTTPLNGSGIKRVTVVVNWGNRPDQQAEVVAIISQY